MTNQVKTDSLGDRIRKAREEARLSQVELGKILQLSDKAVSAYEVDRTEPNLETLRKISQATGAPISYFVDEQSDDRDLLTAKLEAIQKELDQVKRLLMKRGR